MGFFSKVWKGLKKGVKKVARGIKKVVKKIGRAVGKLGIVGQIGMMFLMPYAMGALGGMFGATGTLSSWSTTLLGHSNIASQALGHTLNLINTAGTAVGNVYNSVSSTISGAFDKTGNFLKGRGFVATPTIDPSMAASAFSSGTSTVDPLNTFGADGKVIIDTGFNEAGLNTKLIDSTLGTTTNLVEAASSDLVTSKVAINKTLSDVALSNTKNSSILGPVTKPKGSFLENINVFNKDSAIRQDIANFDAYDYGKKAVEGATTDAVIGGVKAAGSQKIAKALGYEQPEGADYYSFNMPDLMEASRGNPAVFDTVDFLANNSGNAYYGNAVRNNPYMTKLLSDGTSAYDSYMSQFQNQLTRG